MTAQVASDFLCRHTAVPSISDQEFELFQCLIHRETGIYLSDAKRTLLIARLSRRLRELGLATFGAYYRRVADANNPAELTRLIDSICTNETHFFRQPRQFEFIAEQVLPEWKAQAEAGRRPRLIKAWSAGCSTGEEPYSIAMMLLKHCPPSDGWKIDVLGSDISAQALEKARAGFWNIEKAAEIPPQYLKAFMLKGTRSNEGKMKASPELRSTVRWLRLNLNQENYPVDGSFDLIFCRNVLIYFDEQLKTKVIKRLLNHISPYGYLFLGHAENLSCKTAQLRSVLPSIYRPNSALFSL